jgi:hypothetical protein
MIEVQLGFKSQIGVAIIAALFALWMTIAFFSERIRNEIRWGEDGEGGCLSRLGVMAWGIFAWLWCLNFLSLALKWTVFLEHATWLLIAGFIFILVAAIHHAVRK